MCSTKAGRACAAACSTHWGLVLKAGAWYLVAQAVPVAKGGAPRTYRLASLRSLQVLEDAAERPAGFDLPSFWRASSARFEAELRQLAVRLRVSPLGLARLHNARLPFALEGVPDLQGWQMLLLRMESEDMAARQLLLLGAEAEVMQPVSLRASLRALAQAVLERHQPDPPDGAKGS